MALDGAKDRISKFLLGESGSISKKKIVRIGLISFVASAAAGTANAGFTIKDCTDNSCCHNANNDVGAYVGLEGHASGDIDGGDGSKTRTVEAVLNLHALFEYVTASYFFWGSSDLDDYGYELEEVIPDMFSCGEISDHVSMGGGLSDHWNDMTEAQLPELFLHNNDAGVELVGNTLVGSHSHEADSVGGNTLHCHMSDHVNDHGSHNSDHASSCND